MNMNESMGVSHFTGKEMEQTQNKKEANVCCLPRARRKSIAHTRSSIIA
jgi:hypothetical protein